MIYTLYINICLLIYTQYKNMFSIVGEKKSPFQGFNLNVTFVL